jgi:hypothetical protein
MGDRFDDDTPTPPRGSEPTPTGLRRRHMSDTDRALEGAAHRRAATNRSNPYGVPVANDPGNPDSGPLQDHEITSPVDLLDRDLSQAELEIIRRSRRSGDDKATYADVVKLTERMIRRELADRTSRQEQANQLLALLDRPPHEALTALGDRMAAVERDLAPIKSLGRWALGIAASVAVAVGVFLYSRGFTEGGAAARFDALQRTVDEIKHQLEHHSSIQPAATPDAISSATTKDFK